MTEHPMINVTKGGPEFSLFSTKIGAPNGKALSQYASGAIMTRVLASLCTRILILSIEIMESRKTCAGQQPTEAPAADNQAPSKMRRPWVEECHYHSVPELSALSSVSSDSLELLTVFTAFPGLLLDPVVRKSAPTPANPLAAMPMMSMPFSAVTRE